MVAGELKLCDYGLARYFQPWEESYTPGVVTLWYRCDARRCAVRNVQAAAVAYTMRPLHICHSCKVPSRAYACGF